jgi:hypothetical protein
MKWSRTVSTEVRVSRWVRVDGTWPQAPWIGAYRIWLMHDPEFGRWWQRHEWERMDGNRERRADPWIPSPSSRHSKWPDSYTEPEPGDLPED